MAEILKQTVRLDPSGELNLQLMNVEKPTLFKFNLSNISSTESFHAENLQLSF